jgi:DNA-binding response OmpR family regulator
MNAEHKLKILVADDEADCRELLTYLLHGGGYDTCEAADGLAALTMAREQQPDLILLDVMMPELDGLAVCEILKRQADTAHIPVIFLSACGSQPMQYLGVKAGALEYFNKPFIWRELAEKIRRSLTVPTPAAA